MQIAVDDSALADAAEGADRAARAVAAAHLDALAAAVALAMPGSRSADLARLLAEMIDHAAGDVARNAAEHAAALDLACRCYVDTEGTVTAAARAAHSSRTSVGAA